MDGKPRAIYIYVRVCVCARIYMFGLLYRNGP
jgi:hypothetical protein